ncbi:DUF4012 domain-containing protein [Microbacterium sp. KSW4-11]|uniref:DUF4012 domain-containing protein n=1 Tax=Microbacterium gawkjiense TaxID=3067309 RepID=A0ABU3GA64_9MICO|nr:DUF4012 domain-containing protein [Microbacterium sp. KSW4-11]MDT3316705.1 DUF4012 domain-containing protein [Microbacterium sp. KSW4-11]
MPETFLPPAARTAGRVVVWVLGLALLFVLFALGWIAVRGYLAYDHLSSAQKRAPEIASDLGDLSAAGEAIDEIARHTSAARELTSDPLWQGAEGVAWIGPQLAAVADVAAAVDDVVTGTARPIASVAVGFGAEAFVPVDGRIDTSAFAALADPATDAAGVAASARDDVAAIDRTPLVAPIADAVDQLGDALSQVAAGTDALARASTLLPSMLGAEGARNHMVLVQNNAEWRSLGGIVGATTFLRTDDGRITLTGQLSSGDADNYRTSVLDLGEYATIYQDKPGRYLQNVTQVPDFSLSARLAQEFAAREGREVSSVIAIDPVALSYLLEATGPVRLPTGDELTSTNVVKLLLSDVYARYDDTRQQDAFFAAAAASVFEALTAGDVDPAKLVAALGRAGSEHRLSLWSADDAEQKILAGTTLAGAPPRNSTDTARLGVYFNDGGGSKMDYYVRPDVQLQWTGCAAGRSPRTLQLSVTLANTAPADAATSLPAYVVADDFFGVPGGTARVVGEVYLPEGFEVASSEITTERGFGGGMVGGRQVLSYSVDLKPGDTQTVTIEVTADTDIRDAEAWVTPTADADLPPVVRTSCDPADGAVLD